MKRFGLSAVLLASCGTVLPAQAAGCQKAIGAMPTSVDGAVAFTTKGLAVDADGAPNSYLVDGNGLSQTCDGVVAIVNGKRATPTSAPTTWFALCRAAWARARATDDYGHVSIFGFLTGARNIPLIQKDGDPLPGKGYVSTTSMPVPGSTEAQQRHWVDATQIPYYVLPGSSLASRHVDYGDVAVIYHPGSGHMAYGVFADRGPARGEGSVKLHVDLGHDPIVKSGGVERAKAGLDGRVVTLVFPGAATQATPDAAAWNDQIRKVGTAAFDAWGGMERLKACTS